MAQTPETPATPSPEGEGVPSQQPAIPFPQPPDSRFRAFLQARGLYEYATRAGYEYAPPERTAQVLGHNVGSDSVLIPYFDANGAPVLERTKLPDGKTTNTNYIRARLLNVEGQGKYRQLRGTRPHARLTPNCEFDWNKVAKSADVPIMVTEGEFKADLANFQQQDGLPTWLPVVALGGVTSWTGKGSNRTMVAELEGFIWKGRTVYVAFDWDAGVPRAKRYKLPVQAAIEAMASMFTALGATVHVVHLADTKVADAMEEAGQKAKLALDDFILMGGTCEELLATAEASGPATVLSEVLARYAIFEPDTQVIDLTNGRLMSVAEFRIVTAPLFIERPDGKPVPVSKIWEAHRLRRTVRLRGFWPDHPPGLLRVRPDEVHFAARPPEQEDDGKVVVYNDWIPPRGWDAPVPDSPEAEQLLAWWGRFVEGMVGRDQSERFHNWVSALCQQPNRKNVTCWVITSREQGIGKSMLCEVIALMMERSGEIIGPGVLGGRWNDYAYQKLVITASEVEDEGAAENGIKNLLTAPILKIERKGQNAFPAMNYSNLLISTNRPLAFRVSEDGRREIIVHPKVKATDETWMNFVKERIVKWLVTGDDGPGALEARGWLLSWYRNREITEGYSPHDKAPMTDAKHEAAEQSKSYAERVSEELGLEIQSIMEKCGGRAAFRGSVLGHWVQDRMGQDGRDGRHLSVWPQVIKHMRVLLGGQSKLVSIGGEKVRIGLFGITSDEYVALSPSDRAKLMEDSATFAQEIVNKNRQA